MINIFFDLWLFIDILLKFKTGFIKNDCDEVVLNPKEIAREYLSYWFWLDLISTIPFDVVSTAMIIILNYLFCNIIGFDVTQIKFLNLGSYLNVQLGQTGGLSLSRYVRVLRLAKIIKFMRFTRIQRFFKKWNDILDLQLEHYEICVKILKCVMWIFTWFHISACIAYQVCRLDLNTFHPLITLQCQETDLSLIEDKFDMGHRVFHNKSWIALKGLDKDGTSWTSIYIWALFMAISQVLCIGYGQIPPCTKREMLWVTCSTIIGAIFWAIILGRMTSMYESMTADKTILEGKLEECQEYQKFRKLPTALREDMINYYKMRYSKNFFSEHTILSEMNPILRSQLIDHNCYQLVKKCSLLQFMSSNFIRDLIHHLSYEVYQEGDLIMKEGQLGKCMYFISEGTVSIKTESYALSQMVKAGKYFGEISLILPFVVRLASAYSSSYSTAVYVLYAEDFREVLEKHPNDKGKLCQGIRKAFGFEACEEKSESESLTDTSEVTD